MLKDHVQTAENLLGFNDIKQPITDWQIFLQEGGQFLNTAGKGYANRRQVFTAEILYNLVAMAIEKLIMALLMKSGNLPYNHTMHDLVDSMEEFLPGSLEEYGDKLKALDAYQEICDAQSFKITPPSMAEVGEMLDLARQVQQIALAQTAY